VARGFERIDEIIDDRLQVRFDPRTASGSAKLAGSTDLEADVAEVGTWLGNYLRTPTRDYRERIFDNLNDCRRGLARFKRLDLTPEERRWTTELETRFNEVASGTDAVLARHESQRRNEAAFYALRNALDDLLDDEIQAEITKDLAAAKTEAERTVTTAHRASLVLLGIGLLVGASAASITIRRSAALEALNAELQQRIEEGRRTQELLRKSTEQLRALSARLESIQEDERTKIAREIHDVLGQALTSLMLDISWLDEQVTKRQPPLPADRISGKLRSVLALAEDTIETVRRIAMELRPALLDDFGLVAAVEWQTQDFEERTGIPCQLSSRLREASVSTEVSTATFRILQEALANVARHAKASMVAVLLEENDGHLILKVEDNGRGARAEELSDLQSLGVLGMRERAALLGGGVEIAGAPGKGTTVTVKIPLQTGKDLLALSGDPV
jgi:signal transduction histidine kinase